VSVEVEESSFLEAVTKQLIVKTEQTGKVLAGTLVISGGAVIACTSQWCV
jgi:hypothetical protein